MGKIWAVASRFIEQKEFKSLILPGLGIAATAFLPGSRKEKLQSLAINIATVGLTYGSGVRGQVAGAVLGNAQHIPGILRGLSTAYRGGLDARTSAAIPFSHTSVPMDQAFNSLQYAMKQSGNMSSTIGSESAMYAARYLQR